MAITKDQWQAIEKELYGSFGTVTLRLDDRELSIHKELAGENQLAIVVYINGKFSLGWGWQDSATYDPFVQKVWCHKKIAAYKPKQRQRILKSFGKRRAKQLFPNLEKTTSYWQPWFTSFRTFKGMLNKNKALEVVSIGYQPQPQSETSDLWPQ